MALGVQADLAQQASTQGERDAALAQLQQGVQRFGHLAQQLLTLARLEPPAPAAPAGRVDLQALARAVVLELVDLAQARQIDLGLAESEPLQVRGDALWLQVLLRNLVDNAIRYTPEGGHIDVAVRRDGADALLEVRDDGPGIPQSERERVFDRFYRGERAAGRTGSGLGLSIVRRIAEQHHALVTVGAPAAGPGTRVQVHFALAASGQSVGLSELARSTG
jgi:two-component system OmpR family sensor kinase